MPCLWSSINSAMKRTRDRVIIMLCRAILTTVFLGGTAYAQCDKQNLLTTGATLSARSATSGKSLITMEAVGGVQVVSRGNQTGSFTTRTRCEPARAQKLRRQLERSVGR